jgi:MarR family transcriptional regulator, transcriptional regulator for hemolysin
LAGGQSFVKKIPESTQFFRLVIALSMRFRALMDARLADIDLTMQQAALLTFVEAHPPAPTQGELAALLGTTHQNVRQLLDVLVRKRLVRVSVDPEDRRVRRVHCTSKVRQVFAPRDAADHAAIRGWLSALTDAEIAAANQSLDKTFSSLWNDSLADERRVQRRGPERARRGVRQNER